MSARELRADLMGKTRHEAVQWARDNDVPLEVHLTHYPKHIAVDYIVQQARSVGVAVAVADATGVAAR